MYIGSGVSRVRDTLGQRFRYFVLVWLWVSSFFYEKDPVLFLGNHGLSFPGPYHKDFSVWSILGPSYLENYHAALCVNPGPPSNK